MRPSAKARSRYRWDTGDTSVHRFVETVVDADFTEKVLTRKGTRIS